MAVSVCHLVGDINIFSPVLNMGIVSFLTACEVVMYVGGLQLAKMNGRLLQQSMYKD
jgi:hypothetical protein